MRTADWQTEDESIRLFCGDCWEVFHDLPLVDAVVTDPPYGINGGKGTIGRRGRAPKATWPDTEADVREKYVPAVQYSLQLARGRGIVTPGGPNAFEYPKPRDIGCIFQPCATGCSSWGRATSQPVLFYGKDPRAGKHLQPITLTHNQPAEANGHPCPKPLRVMLWMVHRASLPGETVLDRFMGSGTAGVACLRTGRNFIGIEIERAYFDIAVARIEEELRRHPLLETVPNIVQRELLPDR